MLMSAFKWLLTHYKAFQSFIFPLLFIYIFTLFFQSIPGDHFKFVVVNIQGHFLH